MFKKNSVWIICKEYKDFLQTITDGGIPLGNFIDIFERDLLELTHTELKDYLKSNSKDFKIRILFPFPRNAHMVIKREEKWLAYLGLFLDLIKEHDGLLVTGCDWDEYELDSFNGRDIIDIFLSMFRFKGITLNKLVWLYGNVKNAITITNKLSLSDSKPILLYVSYFFRIFSCESDKYDENTKDIFYNISQIDYNKKFLFLNRGRKPHRTSMLAFLQDNNLDQDSFISFLNYKTDESFKDCNEEFYYSNKLYPSLTLEKNDRIKSNNLVLDMAKVEYNDQGFFSSYYWSNSLIYIISETKYFDFELAEGFITEKTFKAFFHNMIFLVLSKVRTLEYLKFLGFKTWDSIIDETYDSIEDDRKRFISLSKEIEILSKIPKENLINIKRKHCIDILIHNKKVLYQYMQQDFQQMIDSLEVFNNLYIGNKK